MKKTTITPRVAAGRRRLPAVTYKGWIISDVWSCYKEPGVTKLPWVLHHNPSETWVATVGSQERAVILAEELDKVADWSEGSKITNGKDISLAFNRARKRAAVAEAERAHARALKKEIGSA